MMAKKLTRPTTTERILNRLGIATQADVKGARDTAYKRGFSEGQETRRMRAMHRRRSREAYDYEDGRYDDPATATFKAGGQGYRLMSGGGRESSIPFDRNLDVAWKLKQSNPIVDRPSKLARDYIIGRGIWPKAVDPSLQEILDDFWRDNKMSTYISELTQQWGDYGAQVVPCAVRHSDGRVEVDYIDPGLIQRVIAHPRKSRQMWAVVVKEQRNQDPWVPDVPITVYKIVRRAETVAYPAQRFVLRHQEGCSGKGIIEDGRCSHCNARVEREYPARVIEAKWHNPNDKENPDSAESTDGYLAIAAQSPKEPWEIEMLRSFDLDDYTGDCFYLTKNADSNQPIGRSDILPTADYCDRLDGTLYGMMEKVEVAKFFMGLLRVIGDESVVNEWQRKVDEWFNAAESGALLTVNESVTDLDLSAPSLAITDDVAAVDTAIKFILGGRGFPVAWYGAPAGAHLATLTAQGDPTWRTLSHDQAIIQAWLVEMLEFVRDQAMIAGRYVPEPTTDDDGEIVEPDTSVALPMPEMTVKDVGAISTALMTVVNAMATAESQGYVTKADGIDATAKVLAELDVHPDVDDLKEVAENESQGALLGMGDGDAVENRRGWFSTHAAFRGDE